MSRNEDLGFQDKALPESLLGEDGWVVVGWRHKSLTSLGSVTPEAEKLGAGRHLGVGGGGG